MNRSGFKAAFSVLGYVMIPVLLPLIVILGQERFESAYPIAMFWLLIFICSSFLGFVYFVRRASLRVVAVQVNRY
jgi:TctA family transporter